MNSFRVSDVLFTIFHYIINISEKCDHRPKASRLWREFEQFFGSPIHKLSSMFGLKKITKEVKESVVDRGYDLWDIIHQRQRLLWEKDLTRKELLVIANLLSVELTWKKTRINMATQIENRIGTDVGKINEKYSLEELTQLSVEDLEKLATKCRLKFKSYHNKEDFVFRLNSYFNGDNQVNVDTVI